MNEGSARSRESIIVGWREWIGLPDLGVPSIKAKIDTGARTSSLHVSDIEEFQKGGHTLVRFVVHPEQRSKHPAVVGTAHLVDRRSVRPSSGKAEIRPVVLTAVELMGQRWAVELTLTSRDEMGFRMLLGRQAIRGRFLVDAGKSFLNGKRVKGTRRIRKPKRTK